ncbi:hypothetical protein O181_083097 [Austropuccinia psidii MF-1]|uniref:Sugar phosphate transporter domain-containing protein n=1 Tax=Austropuccinia psidii MF-1 TaxID=1389203 RepID=A0A9Q3FRQ7_9BASI|nr:hypothetical protein [Austropuccinia psidii MF-1]
MKSISSATAATKSATSVTKSATAGPKSATAATKSAIHPNFDLNLNIKSNLIKFKNFSPPLTPIESAKISSPKFLNSSKFYPENFLNSNSNSNSIFNENFSLKLNDLLNQINSKLSKLSKFYQNLLHSTNFHSFHFILLCSLWYSSSALSSNTGKIILNQFPFPISLTFIQFGLVAFWSGLSITLRYQIYLYSNHQNHQNQNHHLLQNLGIKIPNKSTLHSTLIMSLFSIAGHLFSSMAISKIPVSTVHTIKALSPLFTVIAYTALFKVRYTLITYFSLLPLTLGVMLACSFNIRANGLGFICALASTIVFVSQNIFGKKLLPKNSKSLNLHSSNSTLHSDHSNLDKLNLLFFSSSIAFLLMIPIWFYTDFISIWSNNKLNLQILPSSSLFFHFLCNGTVHFTQCILAFSILSLTSPITYSIASLIKRIAVICLAIIWFGQKVSSIQALGMVLTFLGLYTYNRSKSEIDRGERQRGHLERQNQILLPSTLKDLNQSKNFKSSQNIHHLNQLNQKINTQFNLNSSSTFSPKIISSGLAHNSSRLRAKSIPGTSLSQSSSFQLNL